MDRYIDRSTGFAIGRVRHLIHTELKNRLSEAQIKISPEGISILLLVSDVAEPIRVSDLARMAIRDSTTLKRQVDSLVEVGYVTQERDREDGRAVLVSLTNDGEQVTKKLAPIVDSVRAKAMDGFSTDEQIQLLDWLKKIQGNFLH